MPNEEVIKATLDELMEMGFLEALTDEDGVTRYRLTKAGLKQVQERAAHLHDA